MHTRVSLLHVVALLISESTLSAAVLGFWLHRVLKFLLAGLARRRYALAVWYGRSIREEFFFGLCVRKPCLNCNPWRQDTIYGHRDSISFVLSRQTCECKSLRKCESWVRSCGGKSILASPNGSDALGINDFEGSN